ncbi:SprB repeat-containing protein, partial [Paenimyroides ummariense]
MRKITYQTRRKIPWLQTKALVLLLCGLFLSLFQVHAQTYSYTGAVQTVTLPAGLYEIEMWGADGGGSQGGKGGYSKGEYTHPGGALYIVVGGAGGTGGIPSDINGGYNGGGPRPNPAGATRGSGGGATHISRSTGLLTDTTVRSNIVIVAGGAGGGSNSGVGVGGGGGLTGNNSNGSNPGQGGTQTAGGAAGAGAGGSSGTAGQGGQSLDAAGAGGGGWYGGGAGGGSVAGNTSNGGGGGSGYIGGLGVTNGITLSHTQSGFVVNPDTTGNGTVIIRSLIPCTGTPTAGTASVTPTTRACGSQPFTLSVIGTTMGGGLNYQWQRSDAGTGVWQPISGATQLSYTVTSQTVASDYRFVVTCTNSNSTDTSNIVTMGQPSAITTLSENFDTTAVGSTSNATIPTCWSYIDEITTTGYGYVEAATAQSAPNSFRLYRTNSTTNASQNLVLISPQTDNLGNGTKQLRFSAMATTTNASNILQIVRSNGTTSSSTFTVIQEIVVNHTGYQEYIVPLATTTDDYFGFRLAYNNTTTLIDINIDDVFYENVSPCVFPIGIKVANITTTGVGISWNPSIAPGVTGYDWEVRDINGIVVRSGSTTGVNSTTANVTSLNPATQYFVYVRSKCGTSLGVWTQYPVEFVTLCGVFGNFYENFDTTPTGTTAVESYPRCWSYIDEVVTTGYGYVEGADAISTPNSFRLYRTNTTGNATQNLVLISPETVNLGNGNKRIRFSAMATNTNASNKLQVVRSNGKTATSTFTVIQEIVIDHTSYQEYSVYPPATTDDYFGFRLAHNGTTNTVDINIDDVYYEDVPPLLVDLDKTDILCFGATTGTIDATVEGGKPPYTYAWSPSGATTSSLTNLAAGTYTLTVTDDRGTVTTASTTITQPTLVVPNLTFTNVSCNGKNDGSASVSPSGGIAPYTVLWSDGVIG